MSETADLRKEELDTEMYYMTRDLMREITREITLSIIEDMFEKETYISPFTGKEM